MSMPAHISMPMLKPAQRGVVLLLMGAVVLAACAPGATATPTAPPVPTATSAPTPVSASLSVPDQIGIYASVLRQLYGPDDTFGGTFQAATAYIYRQTDAGGTGPSSPPAVPVVLSPEVQAGLAAALADLPARIVWVDVLSDVPRDSQSGMVQNHGAAFHLGGIVPQADGSVQVAGSIYVASLAAGGTTYVVARQAGQWMVTGNTGSQWIS